MTPVATATRAGARLPSLVQGKRTAAHLLSAGSWTPLLVLTVFGLVFRAAVLVYNLYQNPSPAWSFHAVDQLERARRMLDGSPVPHSYADDYGLSLVHALLGFWDGSPSFVRLQVFHVLVDSFGTVVAWRLGWLLQGPGVAALAGLLYALFLPQVVLAVVPEYDVWASWGLLATTWLVLECRATTPSPTRTLALAAGAGMVGALCGILRSTVIYYPLLAAAAFTLVGAGNLRWRTAVAATIMVAWVAAMVPVSLYNLSVFGEPRPLRGSLGHSFWAGVGQYPNVYGLVSEDRAIQALYVRLVGSEPTDITTYDRRLRAAAVEYARDHPREYLTSCLRRSLSVIWANKYWWVWADTWHPTHQTGSALMGADGMLAFFRAHPARATLSVLGKGVDLLLLPAALFATVRVLHKAGVQIALLPLLYTLLTLAPLYLTPRNTTNAHAATLPIVALGMVLLARWSLDLVRRVRAIGHARPQLEVTQGRP